jgi:vacuolar-type H+-ATPase subunit H
MTEMKKLKIQSEIKTLETTLVKLIQKYEEYPTKNLSDAITHLQATVYAINKV